MGQWAGTSSSNKAPSVPKDEKNRNYVGKWVVYDAREWVIIYWINYKFFG